MPRHSKRQIEARPLAELLRQLLAVKTPQRVGVVKRLEKLHDTIEPDVEYPMEYLVYRATGSRAEAISAMLVRGQAVRPDLRLMIDSLTRSMSMPMPAGDRAETLEHLAQRLNVSTKTIHRWRELGLRWRWAQPPGEGRKCIVFMAEAVEHFLAQHGERVQRAARFSHIDPLLRRRILGRARRIAEVRDVSLNQVAVHLARRVHRAVQTIRQILENHDRDHPGDAIFVDRTGPLDADQKRLIARAYRMGVSVTKMARRFKRTRSTIYRAVHERRAAELRKRRVLFVVSRMFSRDDADEVLLRPQPELEAVIAGQSGPRSAPSVPVDDLPEALHPIYSHPRLEPAVESSLFVRMNYLRYKAAKVRDALDGYEPRSGDLDLIESCLARASRIRDRLAAANLCVVLSVTRRHFMSQSERSTAVFFEMLELGNGVLFDALETFDFNRDQTFEGYLTWSMQRRFLEQQAGLARAHRKMTGEEILTRMRAAATRSGVVLG